MAVTQVFGGIVWVLAAAGVFPLRNRYKQLGFNPWPLWVAGLVGVLAVDGWLIPAGAIVEVIAHGAVWWVLGRSSSGRSS